MPGAPDQAMPEALKDVIVGALMEYSGSGQGVDDMLYDIACGQADQIVAALHLFGWEVRPRQSVEP